MLNFIITDWITAKQYISHDREKSEAQYEKCVLDAIANWHELTKDSVWYINQNGDRITCNRWAWAKDDKLPKSLEDDFTTSYICQLCWDAIHEDFGFCTRCRKVV